MEIAPAFADDVRIGRDGRRYLVTADAGHVARQLAEIDPRVYVEFHEPPADSQSDGFYSICLRVDDNKTDLIFRTASLDGRVVERLRMLNFNLRHGTSEAARMDAEDAAVRERGEREFSNMIRERAEPLMHAIQRSVLGIKPRAFFADRQAA